MCELELCRLNRQPERDLSARTCVFVPRHREILATTHRVAVAYPSVPESISGRRFLDVTTAYSIPATHNAQNHHGTIGAHV